MNVALVNCSRRLPSSIFRKFNEPKQLRSLSSNVNSVDLAYNLSDSYKSPKALVIAHGLFASKASWRSIAKRLNEITKQKIYTVDLRNHGDSEPYVERMTYEDMASDLENFIRKIVIDKDRASFVSVLGHSMGGKTAMTLVLRRNNNNNSTSAAQNLIDRLIVADIAPGASPSTENIKTFIAKMDSIDMSAFDHLDLFKARKHIDAKLCEVERLRNDEAQRQFLLTRVVKKDGKIQWNFNIKSIKNHIDSVMNFGTFDTKFTKPTLFVGGEQSEYISDKDLPTIKHYFPNYKLARISNAGHVIHFDNPVETMNTINEFINK